MAVTSPERSTERRVERLSDVSAKRVIEPDDAVTGDFAPGPIIPDELLLTAGLPIRLTAEQKAALSREQVAAMLDGGIRFESALLAGAGLLLTHWPDLTDPRVTYLLHEVGEETRHSRLFARMVGQLAPKARNPFLGGVHDRVGRRIYLLAVTHPALFCTMVLTGEEIPDLFQRRAVEHPATDPYLRRANAYHREEEARHLAFGRLLLPEMWSTTSRFDRWLVRHVAPVLVRLMMATQLTHPGIYAAVGLPPRRTAWRVNHGAMQRALVAEAMRGVLKALLVAAPELQGRVPRGWRRVCFVDRAGAPLPLPA